MHETEARFGEPVRVDGLEIVPILEVTRWAEQEGSGMAAGGRIRPLGVLIEGPEGVQALDLDGRELPLSAPREAV